MAQGLQGHHYSANQPPMFPSKKSHLSLLTTFALLVVWTLSQFGCEALTDSSKKASSGPPVLSFAVMGDVPYGLTGEELEKEKATLRRQILKLNANDAAEFVVHVGDIKKGVPPCVPQVYEDVVDILRTSSKPLFIIPGDNEWNDCKDPTQAWELWKTNFMRFDEHWPNQLGAVRQSEREKNFAFLHQNFLFLGINLVGGRVHDKKEWTKRIKDNNRWIKEKFSEHAAGANGAILFGHANPGSKVNSKFITKNKAFLPFVDLLDKETNTLFPKPILFIHGDGHRWIRDHPFPNAGDRITRVQVTQGGLESPLIVEIRENPDKPFRLIRRK